jgi:glycyl-tRNA synthetase beta chain
MATDTLLVELRTEELPPKSLRRLAQVFCEELTSDLRQDGLLAADSTATFFATPRRLAVLITNVADKAPDHEVMFKGPSTKSALDAKGNPTPALLGFAKKQSVSVNDLQRMQDGKNEIFVYRAMAIGTQLATSLDLKVEAALKKLPVAKIMRWGDGEAQFVRPVHGLVMLHGAGVISGEVLDIESGNTTRGHRFLSSGEIVIGNAAEYEDVLEKQGRVLACFEYRREQIRGMLEAKAAELKARLKPSEELLDEVTALVEWPAVYVGEFEAEFLQVPQECLILTMQLNQKYFPLFDAAGKLINRFLIVSNMEVKDPRHIVSGNARVVRPRLADARFFFETDKKARLDSRLPKLAQVVYHNKLGSQLERTERLRRLSGAIAHRLHGAAAAAERAGLLCKADLLTNMVGEFPELQGVMGRYYALHDGESQSVADAVEAHYRPRFAGDALPKGNVACAVALADKLDALVGFFGIGQVPTGDKDPFGLRRAALGVLRILLETPLPLDLRDLVDEAARGFKPGVLAAGFDDALHEFMLDRLRGYLREAGHAQETVEAVLALKPARIDLVVPKLEAVREFVALPEAAALAAANKRIVNILRKAEGVRGEADVLLLQEEAEKALFEQMNRIAPLVHSHLNGEDYTQALKALAGLRAAVDAFFDKVMVMAEEPLTRQNRLSLLSQLAGLMNQVADISRLSV